MPFNKSIKYDGKLSCNDNGFTIIEVLIAMAIFAIGILGIASLQISSINSNAKVQKFSEASAVAQNKIELLLSNSFDSIPASPATPEFINGYQINVQYLLDLNGDGVDNTDLDLDGDGDNDIMRVEVVVLDPSGVERSRVSFLKALDN